jgi:ABC-type multidrug transport system fused ATPase/permease subunit
MIMVYVAIVMFVIATGNHVAFQVFSQNIQHRIKILYFRACLEKDAAWFDENNPNEMSSKIGSEVAAI